MLQETGFCAVYFVISLKMHLLSSRSFIFLSSLFLASMDEVTIITMFLTIGFVVVIGYMMHAMVSMEAERVDAQQQGSPRRQPAGGTAGAGTAGGGGNAAAGSQYQPERYSCYFSRIPKRRRLMPRFCFSPTFHSYFFGAEKVDLAISG